ncbi:allophanate hydrolase subunit 1 [Phaeobacter sp. QD34_3]|uniref:5-oxoprolinase subunit B family protein n=1 Tax=unclassified Phaeobacter TaxID=2621772 RepID=UPI00237FCCBB|nr:MULTISPECIES: allophanate hydrolase subunit 1 [unclassified Phaeobacter]MDE4135092.1 allophanate hydrolase subunit 1 [Phaeobacter sp. QD34_3]MDE4138720.1 allophanate hydrolase subunit 1 [Phaeobacter sp. QD34_24]MDE4176755.1 allophanate hydrolase subunit 1 [Phaeobacter sp. PT47_59]
MTARAVPDFPIIRTVGLSGMIVTFADGLSEPSNRATLAFRNHLEQLKWDGVLETSTSLASVYIRFDPGDVDHDRLRTQLQEQLDSRNWLQEALPLGRRFWRVPTVYGTDLAPQLAEAADAAGLSESQAIENLGAARVRVLTIGFAPGQPYLGPLGEEWDLPRQTELTPRVPRGALVLAIRQFVLFSAETPTGWRHVGQTGFMLFRPHSDRPFALQAGDELQFEPVSRSDFLKLRDRDEHMGGAMSQEIPA